jgi:hypothetical protein
MCTGTSDPLSSCGAASPGVTRLTLIQNTTFEVIYLDDGEVTTVSANTNPVEPFTPFSGAWTYFQGVNAGGEGIEKKGFYTVTAVPVPAAIWLFGSGLLGLIGIARRKKAA